MSCRLGDCLGLGVGDTFSVQEGCGRDATIRNLIESTSRPTKQEGWKVVNQYVLFLGSQFRYFAPKIKISH